MTPADLLDAITGAGIRLATNGDRLHVTPSPAGCPDDLRAQILANKPDLIRMVRLRERMQTLAREIGVPDRIIAELPASELEATIKQAPLWPDVELRGNVLVFYLRSLASTEAALPGSVAARAAT